MYQVVVIPNNTTSNLSLCFKTEDKALEVHDGMKKSMGSEESGAIIVATDDFGNTLHIPIKFISYTMFIDVAKSQWREYEQNQCVNRTRELLMKRSPLLAA